MPKTQMEKSRSGDEIEVEYTFTLTDSKGKIIQKALKSKSIINIKDLGAVEYYFNNKGTRMKNKCKVFHADLGWLVLDENYEDLREIYFNSPVIGFKQKQKIKKQK
jgi:hypothetical protein